MSEKSQEVLPGREKVRSALLSMGLLVGLFLALGLVFQACFG